MKSKIKNNKLFIIFSLFGLLAILFISIPILVMLSKENLNSLSNTFKDEVVRDAIFLSIGTAAISTIIALIFGVPLGYLLARKKFIGKSLIQGIVDVPIVIPHTVAGIALITVFGANGMLGKTYSELSNGRRFVDSWEGIVVAMLFVSIPFVINSARDGFLNVDPRLENVSRSLGAGQFKSFATISLPLASKNIFTGAVMAWARAISEFGAVIILVYYPMIAPTLIYDRFTSFGLDYSRPIAVLLILICITVFTLLRFLSNLDFNELLNRRKKNNKSKFRFFKGD